VSWVALPKVVDRSAPFHRTTDGRGKAAAVDREGHGGETVGDRARVYGGDAGQWGTGDGEDLRGGDSPARRGIADGCRDGSAVGKIGSGDRSLKLGVADVGGGPVGPAPADARGGAEAAAVGHRVRRDRPQWPRTVRSK